MKQPRPPGETLRLLWPEQAPEDPGSIDHESALIAERRAKVFRLYTRGLSMRAIGEADGIKVSAATVCRDVNHVLDSYRLMALQDAASHVARELGRLALQEAELWDAWERSKGETVETTTGKREGKNPASEARMKKRKRDGDPRYMVLINRCWAQRCKLLGLFADSPTSGTDGLPPVKYVRGVDPVEQV